MSRLLAGIVVLSFVLAPVQASAQYIDFDGTGAPCDRTLTTPLTTYYQALGVTFGGKGHILNECAGYGVNALSGSQFWAFFHPNAPGIATISFLNPVQSFSIWASGGSEAMAFNVEFFDGNGISQGVTGFGSGAYAWEEISLTAPEISRVEIFGFEVGFVFDDLNASVVPEPSTVILLGTGLLGMAFMARTLYA